MTARGDRVEPSPDERELFGAAPADDALVRRERVGITRPASLPGIELWNAERSSRKWTVHHEAYAFCVVDRYDEGPKHSWWYRRREYSATLDSVMLIEPGELHRTRALAVADFHVLMLQPWLVDDLLGRCRADRGIHFRLGQCEDPPLARLFQRLCELIERDFTHGPGDGRGVDVPGPVARVEPLLFEQALVSFLARSLHAAGEAPRPAPRYCRRSVHLARAFILEHFREKLSLTQLAALGSQSPWHFARSFRAELGVAPGRYVRGVRVGKALDYLRSGFRPHQVAGMVGFCDQAQLTRAFRKELGLTPAYFRRPHGVRAPVLPR